VKIVGMSNLEEIAPEDEARTYRSKPFGKRLATVLAGPMMNIALGLLLLFVVIAGFGKPSETAWSIRAVTSDSAAAQAGLQQGDRIVALNEQPVDDFDAFTSEVRARAGTTVELTISRDGQESVVPVTLGWSLTGSSASRLGLEESDMVTMVGATPIATYPDLVGALQNAQGPVTLTYVRDQGTGTTQVQGPVELDPDAYKGFLGVGPGTVYEAVSVPQAAGDAVYEFGNVVVRSVEGMGRIFSPSGIGNLFDQVRDASQGDQQQAPAVEGAGSAPSPDSSTSSASATTSSSSSNAADRPSSIFGIVNIGAQLGESQGWAAVLALLAIVNIFLGLVNLVPLLPLDGGHVAVACYEEVRSRISHRQYRVNMAKLLPVTYVVILLLGVLFLSTAYLDFVDPVSIK
jgi:membrane-associated protease RseP (regulator of RpoE activity)